ncbi:MAG: flagellin biosynthesis protein FlgD [Fluviicola sp.]|nr:MAG: flagellin biosynthesis protein FlgD [Fluviicola sp.]
MKRIVCYFLLFSGLFIACSFASSTTKKIKCLIQMTNYEGEGAYVIVSLINPKGQYEKTVYVQGDDNEWYYELTSWWKFYGKKRTKLDGITGSTISGGERSMVVIQLDAAKINKGYKLRFESAVEANNYYKKDIEFSLTTANLQKKYNGKGFIRYVRMLPQ